MNQNNDRWLVLLLLLGLLVTPIAEGADRALLIGIDQYPHVRPLVGSVNDVQSMRRFALDTLGYQPDQIQTLLDGEATREGILNAFDRWLIAGSQPGDRVLFYYSGHGYQMPDTNGDEADHLDETLVSVDTEPDGHGGFQHMISDDELGVRFAQLTGRRTTVIIDSCHSGTITRSLLGPSSPQSRKTLDPGSAGPTRDFSKALADHRNEESLIKGDHQRVVWSAVSAAQVALVDEEATPQGGVFTRRFLAGLRDRKADRNGNGEVSYTELLDYVREESAAYCQRRSRDCPLGLTPTLEIDTAYQGQPVFAFETRPMPIPELATELLAHDNPLQAKLEILPGETFRLGEVMQIRVTSPRDAYLVVLDLNAQGQTTQIFPNKFSDKAGKQNRIVAHRPITIPDANYGFKFFAREPIGRGQLLAIVSEDPIPVGQVLAQHKDLEVIARPESYLEALTEPLRLPWTGDRFNRQVSWSLVKVEYEIER